MINPQENTILSKTTMNIYSEIPFADAFPEFTSALSLPYYVDNDVNLSCLGEFFLRRYDDSCRNLLYITLGTGCGSGLILDGAIWYGSSYVSGELGNMRIPESPLHPEAPCVYHRLEDLINLDAIRCRFGTDLSLNPPLSEKTRRDIIDYLCFYLGCSLANLIYTLDISPLHPVRHHSPGPWAGSDPAAEGCHRTPAGLLPAAVSQNRAFHQPQHPYHRGRRFGVQPADGNAVPEHPLKRKIRLPFPAPAPEYRCRRAHSHRGAEHHGRGAQKVKGQASHISENQLGEGSCSAWYSIPGCWPSAPPACGY